MSSAHSIRRQLQKINPVWLALGLLVLLILWLASGQIFSARDEAPAGEEQGPAELSRVEAALYQRETYEPTLAVQGRIAPWHEIELRARISGQVVGLPVEQGEIVQAGTTLIELSTEDRADRVAQLEADLEVVEAELAAAERLQQGDLVAQTERLQRAAAVARVQAELRAAELALEYTKPQAPFNGIYDRRLVDRGDYVDAGQVLARFTDISRLRASGQIPQQEVHRVQPGQTVVVTTLDDDELQGEVRFVASVADPQTRSFYMEAEVDNPERKRIAGGSASLQIQLQPVQAHRIEPSKLRLNADGNMVVRYVDDNNRVAEAGVKLLRADASEAWVTGLPASVRLITMGAGFVEPGEEVRVEMAEESP
ncbi:efflux RND transporter periplasmic adaptor subunit [Aliidiomarina sp. Khilg15.8]